MTNAAESRSAAPTSRRFVFTTTDADALALEAVLKPADRGWRSLLGYAFVLPPLVVVSWLTRNAEWPLWFAAFGVAGLAAWQLSRLVLKTERKRASLRHPIGMGEIGFDGDRLRGMIGGNAIDIPSGSTLRVETDTRHLFLVAEGKPAVILPLAAFAGAADMKAFAAMLKE